MRANLGERARSNIVICINTDPTQMIYATEKPKILSKFAKRAARYYESVKEFNCRQLHLPGINGFRLIKLINYTMSIQVDEKTQKITHRDEEVGLLSRNINYSALLPDAS